MRPNPRGKHEQQLPNARRIRRTCNKELYRTIKRLGVWIPPERVAQAEQLYYHKVVLNLVWIAEHGSDRKALADWWRDNVAPDIAALWEVDAGKLAAAFRDGFGG